MSNKHSVKTFLLNAPYVLWSVIFIIVPLIMVAFYAFTENVEYYDIEFTAPGGQVYTCEISVDECESLDAAKAEAVKEAGITVEEADFSKAMLDSRMGGFTLEHLRDIWNPATRKAFGLSFAYSLLATLIALLLAYPFAYVLSRSGVRSQKLQMLLIMLPMWMNMLIRTYSWMNILEKNGIVNKLLGVMGFEPVEMLGTAGAVILGMVYNYLPYMILPIYTVMSKIDNSLLEAADDLGCNWLQKFRRLVMPLSVPGVISGIIMVFVPSISTFFISQKMSNGTIKLVGDLIEAKIKEQWSSGGLNTGAAMSFVLMIIILICTIIMNKFSDEDGGNIAV